MHICEESGRMTVQSAGIFAARAGGRESPDAGA